MTTIEQAEAGTTPETTPKSVTEALEYAHAYGQVAAFLIANPDLAECAGVHLARYTHIYVSPLKDAVAFIVDAAKRGHDFGAPVEESSDGEYGGVKIHFGPLHVYVYAEHNRVCRRVVTGMVEQVEYALSFDLDGTPRKQAEAAK